MVKMILDSDTIGLPVELKKGEDLNQWLAVNTIIIHDINLLYGISVNFGTKKSSYLKYHYLWVDVS